ncbi:hypothetical protein GGD38_000470 [Chitinophagaceae bacterium OAS944]|nr:hypothetical protein [Chitinophagaceae bacterium OAS944]
MQPPSTQFKISFSAVLIKNKGSPAAKIGFKDVKIIEFLEHGLLYFYRFLANNFVICLITIIQEGNF